MSAVASPFSVVNGVVTYNGVPENLVPDAQRQSAYGRLGNINFGWGTNFDPRFYDETVSAADDSGNTSSDYRLKPEYQHWDGLIQVGIPRSVGGYSEVRDPSQIFWDDDLGYVTRLSNFSGPDEGGISGFLGRNLLPMLALGGLGAIGMTGGFSGLLGGAGSTGLGTYGSMATGLDGLTGTLAGESLAGAGTNLGTYGSMATGLDGLSTTSLTAGGGTEGIASAAQAVSGTGSAPWYERIAQYAMQNPTTAARGVMGVANLVNTLSNNSSSGRSGLLGNAGGSGGSANSANIPALDFTSLLRNYKPMEFDPVPFMTGNYGGANGF